jgi:uncharacterized protein
MPSVDLRDVQRAFEPLAVSYVEEAAVFDCEGDTLIGIVTKPSRPDRRGVLIITGGPQYRIGSHRQFVLLARRLADQGFPVLRFDYRGTGDAVGEPRMLEGINFENLDPDIGAAVDIFSSLCPDMTEVVLWGLCGAASAALMYAHRDVRVRGLVLLNPWVRTQETLARAHIKHYYARRLLEPAFWIKAARGKLKATAALRSFAQNLKLAVVPNRHSADETKLSLGERMLAGLEKYKGEVLIMLSGNDLTAAEFVSYTRSSTAWRNLLANDRVTTREIAGADHTFSSAAWRREVEDSTLAWLGAW